MTWSLFLYGILAVQCNGSFLDASSELETLFGFTTRSQIVTWEAQPRVAWVESYNGKVNIWMASAENNWKAAQVTDFSYRRGKMMITLHGYHNADCLLFTHERQDGSNTECLANPGPPKTFNSVCLSTGKVHEEMVLDESMKILDVRSSRFMYSTGKDIISIDIDESAQLVHATKETILSVTDGSIASLSWSPVQNDVFAFENVRVNHALVGIFQINTSSIEWVAPSLDSDSAPFWSPDGTKIGFYRSFDMVKDGDTVDERCRQYGYCGPSAGPAFAVIVYCLQTKQFIEIFRDIKTGLPGEAFGFGTRPAGFASESDVFFPCEDSGYVQACMYSLQSKSLSRIGPSGCDNRDWIYYNGNILLVHACDKVGTLGIAQHDARNVTRRVTIFKGSDEGNGGMSESGQGVAALGVTGNSGVFFFVSTPHHSTQLYRHTSSTRLQISTDDKYKPRGTVPRKVTFNSSLDGVPIHAQVFIPPTPVPGGKLPAVVYTHGGCMRQSFTTFHFCELYGQYFALNKYLAEQGFVVISIDYRCSVGYGVKYRTAPTIAQYGASEYQDVRDGALWLTSPHSPVKDIVDGNRIGIYGHSYGGLNTLQGIGRDPELFKAAVSIAPVTEWNSWNSQGKDEHLSDSMARTYYLSSPIAYADKVKTPLLLVQGDHDKNVDVSQAIIYNKALRLAGFSNYQVIMWPDNPHEYSFKKMIYVVDRLVHWLEQHLRPAMYSILNIHT